MDLNEALQQFDRTELNLRRLEKVSEQLLALIPDGIVFDSSTPEGRQHSSLRRSFHELTAALPAIDGFRIEADPPTLDDIAQHRLDAAEISEPQILISLEQQISAPDDAIDDYRHRFNRARRELVRKRADELISEVDSLLPRLAARFPSGPESVAEDLEWQAVKSAVRDTATPCERNF